MADELKKITQQSYAAPGSIFYIKKPMEDKHFSSEGPDTASRRLDPDSIKKYRGAKYLESHPNIVPEYYVKLPDGRFAVVIDIGFSGDTLAPIYDSYDDPIIVDSIPEEAAIHGEGVTSELYPEGGAYDIVPRGKESRAYKSRVF